MRTTSAYAQSANFILTGLKKKKGIYYNIGNTTSHVDNYLPWIFMKNSEVCFIQ